MKWKRVVGYSTAVFLLCILGTTPAKGEPNRWEEWRSLNSVGGLFPQIVGLQQLPVVDFLGYPTSSITNPSTGRGRVFYSTTDSLMHCLNSDGSSCFASAGGSGTVTSVSFTGGLISVATPTTTPALTVAGTSGGIPYFSSASTWASSAAGTVNTLMKWGGAGNPPIASSVTDNGTTVSTAELVNFSGTGAASTSPFLLNGTIFTGGSGTTTFPYAYLNFGAAPSSFNTGGVILAINTPNGFAGNAFELHANGGSGSLTIGGTGNLNTTGNLGANPGSITGAKYNTATNCTATASPAVCASAAAGIVQVAAAATTLQINTTAVTTNSRFSFVYSVVGITAPVNIATMIPPYVSAISGGASFTITLPTAPTTNPVNITYTILD